MAHYNQNADDFFAGTLNHDVRQNMEALFGHIAAWRRYLTAADFTELLHDYRPPGLPIEQQPWLASVWRKNKSQSGSSITLASGTPSSTS